MARHCDYPDDLSEDCPTETHINSLEYSDLKLKSYSGELIPVFGQVAVKVNYSQLECELYLHVVDGDGPDLMGRDWIKALGVTLKLGEIHSAEESKSLLRSISLYLRRNWDV